MQKNLQRNLEMFEGPCWKLEPSSTNYFPRKLSKSSEELMREFDWPISFEQVKYLYEWGSTSFNKKYGSHTYKELLEWTFTKLSKKYKYQTWESRLETILRQYTLWHEDALPIGRKKAAVSLTNEPIHEIV